MPKKNQTTDRDELEGMTKEELVEIAEDRGLTVTRGDGSDGEPLKADYVDALAAGAPLGASGSASDRPASGPDSGRLDETIPGGRYLNGAGETINADGKRIDDDGNVIEGPQANQ